MAQPADPKLALAALIGRGRPAGWLDIGPLAGEHLLGALLTAIGNCGPAGVTTVITSGSRPLAVLTPPDVSGLWPDRGQK